MYVEDRGFKEHETASGSWRGMKGVGGDGRIYILGFRQRVKYSISVNGRHGTIFLLEFTPSIIL